MKPTIIRQRNLLTFNEIAEEYDQRRRSPWSDCVAPLIELAENAIILDVGAGTGRQSLAIARGGCDVVAVDFSVRMLVLLKKNAAEVKLDSKVLLVASDMTALPFRSGVFNGSELVAAVHNLPTKQLRSSAMDEIYRVTRAGGRAVITVWLRGQRGFYRALAANAFRYLSGKSDWGDVWIPWGGRPRFYHLFSKDELRSLVSMSGFHIIGLEVKSFGQDSVSSLNRNLLLVANKL